MANWYSWQSAVGSLTGDVAKIPNCVTDTYSLIQNMGLNTVKWKTISNINSENIETKGNLLKRFIEKNAPCLFIYDPTSSGHAKGLKKNYMIGVNDFSPVEQWLLKNKSSLEHYSYLVTTQIVNSGDGFVGSVLSDGKGNMFCETLHSKDICNHRDLSQSGICNLDFENNFSVRNFELYQSRGNFLKFSDISNIINTFELREGYFEFVKGVQLNRNELFVTGYEHLNDKIIFPYAYFSGAAIDLASRINTINLREMQ
jgi:hypothetical protein